MEVQLQPKFTKEKQELHKQPSRNNTLTKLDRVQPSGEEGRATQHATRRTGRAGIAQTGTRRSLSGQDGTRTERHGLGSQRRTRAWAASTRRDSRGPRNSLGSRGSADNTDRVLRSSNGVSAQARVLVLTRVSGDATRDLRFGGEARQAEREEMRARVREESSGGGTKAGGSVVGGRW